MIAPVISVIPPTSQDPVFPRGRELAAAHGEERDSMLVSLFWSAFGSGGLSAVLSRAHQVRVQDEGDFQEEAAGKGRMV